MLLKRIFFCLLLWFPFVGVCVIALVLVFIPLIIYRVLVTILLKRLFRKDLTEPISMPDFLFTTDEFWRDPRGSVGLLYKLNGRLSAEEVSKRISDVITESSSNPPTYVLTYDRLISLTPTFWLGIPFWKKLNNTFELKEHIKKKCFDDDDDINNVIVKWLGNPFPRNRPLWDIILLSDKNKSNPCHSYFGFRIHHVIGDGYSMIYFLNKLFDEASVSTMPIVKMENTETGFCFKKFFWIPLTVGATLVEYIFHSDYFGTTKIGNKLWLARTTLSLGDMKRIRRDLSLKMGIPVPFNTLLLFIFSSALRYAFIRGDLPGDMQKALSSFKVPYALPKSNPHPTEGFSNHWIFSVASVPMRNSNPFHRIKEMLEEITWLNTCDASQMNADFTGAVYPLLPSCLFRQLTRRAKTVTVGLTNLPGPSRPVYFGGKLVEAKYIIPGLQMINGSLTLGCFSYNNQLTISLLGNEEIINTNVGRKLIKYFLKEVDDLLVNGIGSDETLVQTQSS